MTDIAAPGDCHPALRHIAHAIVPMLDADELDMRPIKIPRPAPIKLDPMATSAPDIPSISTLTVRRCCGLAPYVGQPFVYTWHVATDELGRHIAGWRTTIRYLPEDWTRP